MSYKITSLVDYTITLLYLEDIGAIKEFKFNPSDILYINDDSIGRYLNLKGLLDPSMQLLQIRKEG